MMRVLATLLTVLTITCFAATDLSAQVLQDPDDLPRKYRKWLEEEVVYIITEDEHDGFLQLTSNDLRDKYIEHFWKVRDPTPGTRANEFKTEHYSRIEYANKYFGVRAAKNGWRNDRGRYYILLGKPKQRTEFPNNTLVYPVELWFYQVPSGTTGGVNFFYLIFFRKSGAGDYVLYHPALDGPQSLTWKGNFDTSDSEVMQGIQRLDRELSVAAQGYDPMNPGNALASEVLIGQIDAIPENTIDDSWAQKFVDSKGEVVVNYSFVPLDLNVPVAVHADLNKQQYIHYGFSLDPKYIDAGQHEDRYYVVFEIIPSLADMDGNVIYEQTKTAEINWTPQEFQDFSNRSLIVTDFIPAIPGDYTFTLRVKNNVAKKFYLHTQPLTVPDPSANQFTLAPLTLNLKYEQKEGSPDKIVPFKYFNVEYQPSDRDMFANEHSTYLFTELYFPRGKDGEQVIGEITFNMDIYKDDTLVKKVTHIIPEDKINNIGIVYLHREIVFEDMELGDYRLEVTATEARNGYTSTQRKYFQIADPSKIPLPNMFTLGSKEATRPIERTLIRANEYRAAGKYDVAEQRFMQILSTNNNHLDTAIAYADMLQKDLHKPEKAIEILREASRDEPNNEELVTILAKSSEDIEDWSAAAGFYERLIFIDETNLEAVNASARIALKRGKQDLAKKRLEQSLLIDSNQEDIKATLDSLK